MKITKRHQKINKDIRKLSEDLLRVKKSQDDRYRRYSPLTNFSRKPVGLRKSRHEVIQTEQQIRKEEPRLEKKKKVLLFYRMHLRRMAMDSKLF